MQTAHCANNVKVIFYLNLTKSNLIPRMISKDFNPNEILSQPYPNLAVLDRIHVLKTLSQILSLFFVGGHFQEINQM